MSHIYTYGGTSHIRSIRLYINLIDYQVWTPIPTPTPQPPTSKPPTLTPNPDDDAVTPTATWTTRQASILDRNSVLACASLCRGLFGELVQFDLRNGPLRKKFDGVKYDVRKVDDILYELALLGGADGQDEQGQGEAGGHEDGDDGGSRKRKEREEEEGREAGGGGGGGSVVLDTKEFEAIRVAMTTFDEKR